MRTCEARVTKTFKFGSVRTTRPYPGKTEGLEVCGGTIRFSPSIIGGCQGHHGEDDYCYCGPTEIHITASCSRCSVPYFPEIDHICAGGLELFQRLLNEEESV